jgi:hypothetical protein
VTAAVQRASHLRAGQLKGVKRGWHAVHRAPGVAASVDFAAVAANRKPVTRFGYVQDVTPGK